MYKKATAYSVTVDIIINRYVTDLKWLFKKL